MKKSDAIKNILQDKKNQSPRHVAAKAFAPTNIALCKYWGKRDSELNLPVTSSLSISLGDKGAHTDISLSDTNCDVVTLNQQAIALDSPFGKRLVNFLNLFRDELNIFFNIDIKANIPIAAGLASSACGFASLVQALNHLFGWELSVRELSMLARLGSGSASRSLWQGFVEWHAGVQADGSDSYAESIPATWPALCVGLLVMSQNEKPLSSREAMQRTVMTSPLYSAWPTKVAEDMSALKQAITAKDFNYLGQIAESNAMTMHATMLSAWPPVSYALPETVIAMQKIWQLRQDGLEVYFTQDAGPNLKLLFLEKDISILKLYFPNLEILQIFT